jgi:hypothetical protein
MKAKAFDGSGCTAHLMLYDAKGEESSDQQSCFHPKILQKNQVAEFQDAGIV